MIPKRGSLKPRPYARLMHLLSDQLIKDNTVALTEIAKNSYDADAEWVQIRIGNMQNFGKDGVPESKRAYVEIEDNGDGMSFDVIKDAWMNPATPTKRQKKDTGRAKTEKGRIIQGEKGIGRFAVFQIGKRVEIYTRERRGDGKGADELYLISDFNAHGFANSAEEKKKGEVVFFDEIEALYEFNSSPIKIVPRTIQIQGQEFYSNEHGTLIRITELNYPWDNENIKKVQQVLARLQTPFEKNDFLVSILVDGEEVWKTGAINLETVLNDALIRCSGKVDKKGSCTFELNEGKPQTIDLLKESTKEWVTSNRYHFLNKDGDKIRTPECGSFAFKFYIYDLKAIADKEIRTFVRDHRTYIYRDSIRVYPYGDPDNDWIKLDIYRGIHKASYYLSNNNVIGYVQISAKENPNLIDKTSREGLIEQTGAFEDLRLLVLAVLARLKIEYDKKLMDQNLAAKHREERIGSLFERRQLVIHRINNLQKHLEHEKDSKGIRLLEDVQKNYLKERDLSDKQIEVVEDLAGVGIAVDATSHDVMVMLERIRDSLGQLDAIITGKRPNLEMARTRTKQLGEKIDFVQGLMKGIQPLFRSARRKDPRISIASVVKKVEQYYQVPLKRYQIATAIKTVGQPLVVTGSEGVLLQVFINFFDNAVYWLHHDGTKEPRIEIEIDGDRQQVIFSDNGPGISSDNARFVFEAFFSTKGLDGRGLGLYIARQLTDRYEYELSLIEENEQKKLSGANFLLRFPADTIVS